MKCSECNMAHIPYIEHRKRMFKAYQREEKLKHWLLITNLAWLIAMIIVLVR